MEKRAIIVGASSGIGEGLAKILVNNGYRVAITGRRKNLLEKNCEYSPDDMMYSSFDVTHEKIVLTEIENLIGRLGGLELLVISAGTGAINPDLDWETEYTTIQTNVIAFTRVADFILKYFLHQGFGHLVCISSIASIRGSKNAPAYNASKAFQCNYIEGLQIKAREMSQHVFVTDIRPGFVKTALAFGNGIFWAATVEKASTQIYKAIKKRKRRAYITFRWTFIALILRMMPSVLYERLKG